MTDLTVHGGDGNKPILLPIKEVMESNYLDYSMSVITDRALPDVRDGLKPVHRRILYAMHTLGIGPNSPHKKSARVVGDVIGKYHPHGDSAVYESAVRMAQPWVMQSPLIDGQGNFGSIDGDSAAAMRYTEMRMSRMAYRMFSDIGKNTVDYRDNYDGTESEPVVLPVNYPNLWVNGSEGIAVGMATSVPPHNLGETIDAFLAWQDNPDITEPEIAQVMPAPDFPSGGLVYDLEGYIGALKTGRGRVKVRSKWHCEDRRGGQRLVFTELPYLVNKARLVEQIADLVRDKSIDGVVALRDESNKKGIRVVIDIKKGFDAERMAQQLVTQTDLETSINYNVRALVGQRPIQLGIKEVFRQFRKHRIEVIQRRTQYDLDRSLERLHLLEGYLMALDRLDDTIKTIRESDNADTAKTALVALLGCDELQAQAILDLRLQRLTGMQIQDIRKQHDQLTALVADLRNILATPERQQHILTIEMAETRDQFSQPRRTEVATGTISIIEEELIEPEEVMIIATEKGFLKRMPTDGVNRQGRGTRGRSLMDVGDDDVITAIHTASTVDYLMAMTHKGQLHAIKVHQIPEGAPGSKGRHYRNTFEGMEENTHVVAMLSAQSLDDDTAHLMIATDQGYVKRTGLSNFSGAIRKTGVSAINPAEREIVVGASVSRSESDEVMLVASNARAVCFQVSELRPMGRSSRGVRGIKLEPGDRVVMATSISESDKATHKLVCVGERGVGKASLLTEFPTKGRGGKGMIAFGPNRRSGELAAATLIDDQSDILLLTDTGGGNRLAGSALRPSGRNTAGSILINAGSVIKAIAIPPSDQGDTLV